MSWNLWLFWLRSVNASRRPTKPQRKRFRPSVELLEERLTPASVELVSYVDPNLIGNTSGSGQITPSVSADGRYVTFVSLAPNLVAGQIDASNSSDVFLYDRVTGTTLLVSRALGTAATTGNGLSSFPVISGDGRYVAYRSNATNLFLEQIDQNGLTADVFLFDRISGTTTLVSRAAGSAATSANNASDLPVISSDGRFVAYRSNATNLVAGQIDTPNTTDVFLFDRVTGSNTLVSHRADFPTVAANNVSELPVINSDGRYVAYRSRATNLVGGQIDTNNNFDVFLFDRMSGMTTLVSRAAGFTVTTANSFSSFQVISGDGRFVAYTSTATNLVPGQFDPNTEADAFLFDQVTGSTVLISRVNGSTAITAGGDSGSLAINSDGRLVAFASRSTSLVAGQTDTNTLEDVFLFDRVTETNTLISRAAGTTTTTPNERSGTPAISSDVRYVVFGSFATNLVAGQTDTNALNDVFLFDRVTGTTTLVSHAAGSSTTTGNHRSLAPATLSDDGNYVAYLSISGDLVAGQTDTNQLVDLFVFDRQTSSNSVVSLRVGTPPEQLAGDGLQETSISADGRFVAFAGSAIQRVAGFHSINVFSDVFLLDRTSDSMVLVSRAAGTTTPGNSNSTRPVLSGDGRYVAYLSRATNLVAGQTDTNTMDDVFLFDRESGTTLLVSRAAGSATTTANRESSFPVISSDGRYVAYLSKATNLVPSQMDTNNENDVFLFDRVTSTTTLISSISSSPTTTGNGISDTLAISSDGSHVVFQSTVTNLVTGQTDTNNTFDVFLFDRSSQTNRLVSHAVGFPTTTANHISRNPSVTSDGRYVAFSSVATNLIAGLTDANSIDDVFLFDRINETITLVSRATGSSTTTANNQSTSAAISSDGNHIAYRSLATNLVAGQVDTNGNSDIFLFDRVNETNILVSRAAGFASTTGNGLSDNLLLSGDGRFVAYGSRATNLVAGHTETNGAPDVFVFDRLNELNTLASRAVGSPTTTSNGFNNPPSSMNNDGRFLVFNSNASNLVPGDFNSVSDVFLFRNAPASIWDGGSSTDNNWMTAANWVGDTVPQPGNVLLFPAGAARLANVNNFAAGTRFQTITITGPGYDLSGNRLEILEGIVASYGSGTATIRLSLDFLGSQTIKVDQASALQLTGTLIGQPVGNLTMEGAGHLIVSGAVTFPSTTINAGTVQIDGSLSSGLITVNGVAVLSGSGLLTGNVLNHGTVRPGQSSGILTIDGNYTQSYIGLLQIELGGLTVGTQFDRLAITGTANLNGTLEALLIDSFVPNLGDSFRIKTFGSRNGDFSTLSFAPIPNRRLLPSFDAVGLTLTTVLDTLRVTSLAPTPTGFVAVFNQQFDSTVLNLYDTQTGGLGTADVTLVGGSTGAVRGSLLVGSSNLSATFLATSGLLPPDTYSVILRSGGNGFQTPAGGFGQLDGNSDATPGEDFMTAFTVFPTPAVTVGIPNFARGPGQTVNAPITGSGIPLRLSNGAGVSNVSLTLLYNPNLLTIAAATRGPATAAGATVSLNTSIPGQAIINFNNGTALSVGPIDIVILTANVPNTAGYTSKHLLDITSLSVNSGAILSQDDDGIHIVGYLGDASGNGTYSSIDANRVQRVGVGLDSGFSAYQLADPVIVADVTNNGLVNATDATRVLQEAVGIDRPEIPPLPLPPVSLTPGGPDPLLYFPKKLRGVPGQTITVPLLLEPAEGLAAVDVALAFDVARLELLSVERGDLTGDFDLFAVNADGSTVRVTLGRSAGPMSGKAKGSVVLFTFRIKDTAPPGSAVINLRQSVGSTLTQLNEGGLDLNPDPSDASDDALDGMITVQDRRNARRLARDLVFAELLPRRSRARPLA